MTWLGSSGRSCRLNVDSSQKENGMATMLRFRYSRSFAQRLPLHAARRYVGLMSTSLFRPRLSQNPVMGFSSKTRAYSRYPGNGHASWPIPVLLPASFRRSSSPFSPHYLFLVSLFL